MEPLAVAGSVFVAVAILILPGLAVAAALGLRGIALVAASAPTSVAVVGVSGVLANSVGLQFSAVPVVVVTTIASAGGWFIGRFTRRRNHHLKGKILLPALVGFAVAALAMVIIWLVVLPQTDALDTSYDGVFHLNAVAWILDTGDGSAFHLYRVNHPGSGLAFYPAGWHDIVALTVQISHTNIPAANNSTWLAVAIAAWIPGSVMLADVLLGHRFDRKLLIPVSAVASTVFIAFPLLLWDWGALYPTFLAYAIMPTGVALAVAVISPRLRLRMGIRYSALDSHRFMALIALCLWAAGAAFAHPRSLFTWALFVLPLAGAALVSALSRWWAIPRYRRRIMVWAPVSIVVVSTTVVVGLVIAARYFGLAERPISDRLNGGPATAHQGIFDAIGQVLLQAPILSPSEQAATPSLVVAVLVVLGLVLAAIRRETRWILVSYLVVAALYVLAAGSNGDLAKVLTAPWYKDKYRLISALPIVGVVLATMPVAAGITALKGLGHGRRVIAIAGAALLATGAWLSPGLGEAARATAVKFELPQGDKHGALLNQDDLRLLEELPDHLPDGELLLGNPWNGSVLAQVIGDREAVFPHFTGSWDVDRIVLATSLDHISTDPVVCDAVRSLNARWLFYDPELMWGGDPQADFFAAIDRAAVSGEFVPVARSGSATLYRIDQCD